MKKSILILLSIIMAVGWSLVYAQDGFYVIPTMKGNYAPVPKTGWKVSVAQGDDGNLQKGVAWPTPRFADNNNGTVTDSLTGLIWLKDANLFGQRTWSQALNDCNNLAAGSPGLTDGSQAGDWRLPNVKELLSLLDYSQFFQLPGTHPFTGVQYGPYWSSTPTFLAGQVWTVTVNTGETGNGNAAAAIGYVWPVRGGT